MGVKYDYIDVDLLVVDEQDKIMKDLSKINPQDGFPTILIDKVKTIVGFQPDAVKEVL
jgi:glutaredoxin